MKNKNKNLDAHIKFEAKLFHLTWEKKGKSKTCHRFLEQKGEFGGLRNESLCFKWGTPTVLGPNLDYVCVWYQFELKPSIWNKCKNIGHGQSNDNN